MCLGLLSIALLCSWLNYRMLCYTDTQNEPAYSTFAYILLLLFAVKLSRSVTSIGSHRTSTMFDSGMLWVMSCSFLSQHFAAFWESFCFISQKTLFQNSTFLFECFGKLQSGLSLLEGNCILWWMLWGYVHEVFSWCKTVYINVNCMSTSWRAWHAV